MYRLYRATCELLEAATDLVATGTDYLRKLSNPPKPRTMGQIRADIEAAAPPPDDAAAARDLVARFGPLSRHNDRRKYRR